jgi:hypothetical protein
MDVDHGRLNMLVPGQILHFADIHAVHEQMRCETKSFLPQGR